MKVSIPFLVCLASIPVFVCRGGADTGEARVPDEKKALIVPMKRELDQELRRAVSRVIEDRVERDRTIRWVVFELDTPGGEYGAAHEIANSICGLDRKGVHTVAYIPTGKTAYSGGTLIAMACKEIVMGERAFMGAVAPVAVGPGVLGDLPESIQSPVRKNLGDLARLRGYPVALAQAMVSKDQDVLRVTFDRRGVRVTEYMNRTRYENLLPGDRSGVVDVQVVVEKGRILTLSTRDAKEHGFIRHVALDRRDLFAKLGIAAVDPSAMDAGAEDEVIEVRVRDAGAGPVCVALRTKDPIDVNGKRDEPAWAAAKPVSLGMFDGKGTPSRRTEVRVLWDDAYVYLFFSCADPEISSRYTARDSHMWTEDVVEVFFDVDPHDPRYAEIEVTPAKGLFDAFFLEHRRDVFMAWDPEIRYAVEIDGTLNDPSDRDRGWNVEMAIPHRDLVAWPGVVEPPSPPRAGTTWRVNFYRNDRSRGLAQELQAWSPTRGDFHERACFGVLRFSEGS